LPTTHLRLRKNEKGSSNPADDGCSRESFIPLLPIVSFTLGSQYWSPREPRWRRPWPPWSRHRGFVFKSPHRCTSA